MFDWTRAANWYKGTPADRAHSQSKNLAGRCPAQPFTPTVAAKDALSLSLSLTLHCTTQRGLFFGHWHWLRLWVLAFENHWAPGLFACAHLLCSSQAFILDWSGRRHALAAWKGYSHTWGPPFGGWESCESSPSSLPLLRAERAKAPRSFPALTYPASCCATATVPMSCRLRVLRTRILPESTGCHSQDHSFHFVLRDGQSSRFKCIKCGLAAGHPAILAISASWPFGRRTRPSSGLVFFNYPSNCP